MADIFLKVKMKIQSLQKKLQYKIQKMLILLKDMN